MKKDDKNKFDIKRRIFALLLSSLTVLVSVFSGPAALSPVNASASAASVDSAVEALALLYSFFETCAIAGGVKEGLESYESEKDLLDAFMDFVESATVGRPYYKDITYTLEDGTIVTWDDLDSLYKSELGFGVIDGTGALKDLSEDAYNRFRVINGGLGSGGGEDPDKDPFSKIQKISIGTGASLLIADFLGKLYNGEIDGLNPEDYYGTYFDGTYERDSEGNYVIRGSADGFRGNNPVEWTFNGTLPYAPALYVADGKLYLMLYDEANGVLMEHPDYVGHPEMQSFYYQFEYSNSSGGGSGFGLSCFKTGFKDYNSYEFNFPVFENKEAAQAFLTGGEVAPADGVLNLRPYKVASLIGSIMETVAPLLNTQLNPEALPAASTAAAAAAETLPELLPELVPNADPYANTEAYKQAVTDAIAEATPAPEPEPSPDPAPVLAGSETVKKYKRDLTLIFPFCIPFDLIHFFQVMNAEPVAPCFHFPFVVEPLNINIDVELDMAFLEPAMEIFRMGELGLFILGLIMSTSKVIRW